jgi:hypothetical protein
MSLDRHLSPKTDARRGSAKQGEHNRRTGSLDLNRGPNRYCLDETLLGMHERATMITGTSAAQTRFSAPHSRGLLSSRTGKPAQLQADLLISDKIRWSPCDHKQQYAGEPRTYGGGPELGRRCAKLRNRHRGDHPTGTIKPCQICRRHDPLQGPATAQIADRLLGH